MYDETWLGRPSQPLKYCVAHLLTIAAGVGLVSSILSEEDPRLPQAPHSCVNSGWLDNMYLVAVWPVTAENIRLLPSHAFTQLFPFHCLLDELCPVAILTYPVP